VQALPPRPHLGRTTTAPSSRSCTSNLRRVDDQLTQRLGRSPTIGELAEATSTTIEAVLEALEARGAHHGVSIDGSMNSESDDLSLAEFLGTEDGDYDRTELRLEISTLLESLSPTDRRVIVARFFDGRSQQQIADELGISQSYLFSSTSPSAHPPT